jgi:plastocyanin
MTSNINPNNIDGAYPVAGQDNNSQGFRDNFTNTSQNFQYAADEITDLQNNAVLKSALVGTTLNNNMNGSILSNATLQQIGQTCVALGTLAGTVTINYTLGSVQTVTTNGPISLNFTNFLPAGVSATVAVQITVVSTAHTVQFPTAVSVNNQGIQGLNTSTNTITFASAGVYTFVFSTSDGGTNITVNETNKEIQPFNNSASLLNDTGGANLAVTTSYFTTVAPSTASLAPGATGQIKVFVMNSWAGNMIVTAANAGWKSSGSGNLLFTANGQGCTLQYVNSKWFCIGNNGVTFS